jgi:hypothetical protein
LLPGAPTIPDQISADKKPYYDALEKADQAFAQDNIDVSVLEGLMEITLAAQLLNAAKQASTG